MKLHKDWDKFEKDVGEMLSIHSTENKITLDKKELFLLMEEYWAIDNNQDCIKATMIFLKRNGLLDEGYQEFPNLLDECQLELTIDDLDNYHNELSYRI